MLREMQEIKDLATKYSRAQLGQMVQLGMLDPQKAMMAGMLIQRIEQQNAKPPQTTVAQEVLGLPSVANQPEQQPQPTQPQAEQPQMGQQQVPQEQPAGVSALPSNIPEMATGGIVAFDEGGHVPGYAGGTDGSQVSEYGNMRSPDGGPPIPLDRSYGETPWWDPLAKLSGLMGAESRYSADKGKYSEPDSIFAKNLQGSAYTTEAHNKLLENNQRYNDLFRQRRELRGAFGFRSMSPDERAKLDDVEKQMASIESENSAIRSNPESTLHGQYQKQIAAQRPAAQAQAAYPAQQWADVTQRVSDAAISKEKEEKKNAAPPSRASGVASLMRMPGSFNSGSFEEKVDKYTPKVGEMPLTKEKSPAELSREMHESYAREGYDPGFLKNIITGIEQKKGALADEKDRALGEAIMMTGLKLLGARKGQEFQNFSEGAQEGLKGFQSAMKEVKARQDKYDERIEALQAADQQARKTGAESVIARAEKLRDQAHADQVKLFEAKNEAAKTGINAAVNMTTADKQLFGTMYHANVSAAASRDVAGRTPAEIQLIERIQSDPKFAAAYRQTLQAKTDPRMEMQLRNDYAKDLILQKKYPDINDYLRAMGVTPGASGTTASGATTSGW